METFRAGSPATGKGIRRYNPPHPNVPSGHPVFGWMPANAFARSERGAGDTHGRLSLDA